METHSLSVRSVADDHLTGPTLGGLLIAFTKSTISVFYLAAITHFIFAVFAWIVLPESLTQQQMLQSVIKYEIEMRSNGTRGRVKRVFRFLSPLAIFIPEVTDADIDSLKVAKDWNLLIIILAYAFTVSIMVRTICLSFPSKSKCVVGFLSVQVPICGCDF